MAIKIWEFRLPEETPFTLSLPKYHQILTCQAPREIPIMYVLVKDDEEKIEKQFFVIRSHENIPGDLYNRSTYIGTFRVGIFDHHLFETLTVNEAMTRAVREGWPW